MLSFLTPLGREEEEEEEGKSFLSSGQLCNQKQSSFSSLPIRSEKLQLCYRKK